MRCGEDSQNMEDLNIFTAGGRQCRSRSLRLSPLLLFIAKMFNTRNQICRSAAAPPTMKYKYQTTAKYKMSGKIYKND